jgi:hypothetical protein
MASDRLARPAFEYDDRPERVADPVKLAAIKDALDRSGIQAKTAVSVEVSTKPYEFVFDRIVSSPRSEHTPALTIEGERLDQDTDNSSAESTDDSEIVGEIDEDDLYDDLSRIQREPESAEENAEIIDVEPVSLTPDPDDSSLSVNPGLGVGPLGMSGPVGSGLMSLQDANEAVAEMRQREVARQRNLRRR